jgi:hypothetical protein
VGLFGQNTHMGAVNMVKNPPIKSVKKDASAAFGGMDVVISVTASTIDINFFIYPPPRLFKVGKIVLICLVYYIILYYLRFYFSVVKVSVSSLFAIFKIALFLFFCKL